MNRKANILWTRSFQNSTGLQGVAQLLDSTTVLFLAVNLNDLCFLIVPAPHTFLVVSTDTSRTAAGFIAMLHCRAVFIAVISSWFVFVDAPGLWSGVLKGQSQTVRPRWVTKQFPVNKVLTLAELLMCHTVRACVVLTRGCSELMRHSSTVFWHH